MVPESSDTHLVEKAASGDRRAFEELVTRYSRFAGAVALAVTGDFHGARDVVQESFIKVYGSLGSVKEPDKFRAWLRNVVKTTALDWRRRNKKGVQSLDALEGAEAEGRDPGGRGQGQETLDANADRDELRAKVREEIERLPESHREVVALKYLDGKSYEEIEAITGLSQATIESRLFRARQKLKTRFERVLKKRDPDSLTESKTESPR